MAGVIEVQIHILFKVDFDCSEGAKQELSKLIPSSNLQGLRVEYIQDQCWRDYKVSVRWLISVWLRANPSQCDDLKSVRLIIACYLLLSTFQVLLSEKLRKTYARQYRPICLDFWVLYQPQNVSISVSKTWSTFINYSLRPPALPIYLPRATGWNPWISANKISTIKHVRHKPGTVHQRCINGDIDWEFSTAEHVSSRSIPPSIINYIHLYL